MKKVLCTILASLLILSAISCAAVEEKTLILNFDQSETSNMGKGLRFLRNW